MKNVNSVVLDVHNGKARWPLLEDKATAADVKQSIANVRQTTETLNGTPRVSTTSYPMFNRRQLIPKMDDTLIAAKSASQNLDLTSQRINTTLKTAFGRPVRRGCRHQLAAIADQHQSGYRQPY